VKLPPKQREYLKLRIAQALTYYGHATYVSDDDRAKARRMAETMLATMEDAATTATTMKAAVHNIIERMDKTA
jgi:hypothetical protein